MINVFKRYIWLLLACVVGGLYWKALYFGLVWDDKELFSILSYFQHLKDVFAPINISALPVNYYRPMALLSWLADRRVWGTDPIGYHTMELLLHAMNVILVYLLSKKLLSRFERGWLGALIAASVFAVHPVQVEAVCWISGRPELLFTALTLASFLFFLHYRGTTRPIWLVVSLACWFLALLSKETAFALLPCMFLYDMLFTEKVRKGWLLKPYIWFVLAFLIYFFLRQQYLPKGDIEFVKGLGAVGLLRNVFSAYGFYLQQAIFPTSLSTIVFELPRSNLFILYGFLILLCVLFMSVWTFKKGNRLPLYFLCFFLITLAPSVAVAVTGISNMPLAERYLYLPSFAFCFLIGLTVISVATNRQAAIANGAVFLIIFTLYAYRTTLRIPVWKNNFTFFQAMAAQNPDQGLPYQYLGLIYHGAGEFPRAVEFYNRSLTSKFSREGRSLTYNNLGMLYLYLKRYDEAEKYLQQALKENNTSTIYHSLGYLYLRRAEDPKGDDEQKLLKKSIVFLEECLRRTPDYNEAKVLLEKATKLLENGGRVSRDKK